MNEGKRISKVNTVLFIALMALCLIILFCVFYAKVNGKQPRIFGYSFHIVLSDSMSPDINAGDFIAALEVDKENIKQGDYILFVSPDPSLKGITIVHKVHTVNNEQGVISFVTTGIKEGAAIDTYPVYDIIGKYSFKSSFLGKVLMFLSKAENILFFIFIVTMFVIITKQIKKIIRVKKEADSQTDK